MLPPDDDATDFAPPAAAQAEDTLRRRWLLLRLVPQEPERRSTVELALRVADTLGIELLPDSRDSAWRAFLRKIERDLKAMSESPAAWSGQLLLHKGERKNHLWSFPHNKKPLLPTGLTADEALDFWLIEQHLSPSFPIRSLTGLAGYFAMARTMATEHSHWSQQFRVLARQQPIPAPSQNETVLTQLIEALRDKQTVTLVYRQRQASLPPETLAVDPLGLVYCDGVGYLVGAIRASGKIHSWRVSRIESVKLHIAEIRAYPAFDLDRFIASTRLAGSEVSADEEVKLRFYDGAGLYLAERQLPADWHRQDISATETELRVRTPLTEALRWWILSFGDRIEVLEPAKLRQELAVRAQKMAARYS